MLRTSAEPSVEQLEFPRRGACRHDEGGYGRHGDQPSAPDAGALLGSGDQREPERQAEESAEPDDSRTVGAHGPLGQSRAVDDLELFADLAALEIDREI